MQNETEYGDNESIDEDYYKPIKTTNGFGDKNKYIEYESKGHKDKNLSPKEYLDLIRPYLSNIINNHKTPKILKVLSSNEAFDNETQFGELKIQLTVSILFLLKKILMRLVICIKRVIIQKL